MMKRSSILLTLVILLLLAAVARAKPDGSSPNGSSPTSPGADYEIAWWTVDSGGGTFSTGGDYELGGTVGQPDAGESSGGDYGLTGGFWNGAPPACAEVAGVNLALATSGVVYTNTVVEFSADIVPDGADKPYTYTIDYGDGDATTSTSSDDPLTTPLDHTFIAAGTYDVEIAVWNCNMIEAAAVTDTAQVVVSEQGVTCVKVTGVDLNLVTSGDIYTDTVVEFSADVVPDNASKPYTYTVDYGDGISTTTTSSDDPLTTPLDHTFAATGTYDVEIAVWNCDMTGAEAVTSVTTALVTDTHTIVVQNRIYLPLVMRSSPP